MHLINLRAQRTIEMQLLKLLNTLRTFENSPMRMTDNTDSVLKCLTHTLHINLKLLHAESADHNAFIII